MDWRLESMDRARSISRTLMFVACALLAACSSSPAPEPSGSLSSDLTEGEYLPGPGDQPLQGDRLGFVAANTAVQLGDVETVAQQLRVFDVLVLSHTSNAAPSNGCNDYVDPNLSALVRRLRELNPRQRIFGYVAATVDIPDQMYVTPSQLQYIEQIAGLDLGKVVINSSTIYSYCGNNLYDPSTPAYWNCNGACYEFINSVNRWISVQEAANANIDGLFIDLVGSQWITPSTRDNIFSYVKSLGKRIMANVGVNAANTTFAGESAYFGNGDYVFMEGLYVASGTYASADASLAAYAPLSAKGVLLAAWATERWATTVGETVACGSSNDIYAYKKFLSAFQNGSVYQYATQDGGISSHIIPACEHQTLYANALAAP